MRSKLLSLHLIHTILTSYMPVFVEPTSLLYSGSSGEATHFLEAAKQYLCLSISRNAVSSVPQVFELSVDMFWRLISGMRSKLKVSNRFWRVQLCQRATFLYRKRLKYFSTKFLFPSLKCEPRLGNTNRFYFRCCQN